jgi:hypothetical protein
MIEDFKDSLDRVFGDAGIPRHGPGVDNSGEGGMFLDPDGEWVDYKSVSIFIDLYGDPELLKIWKEMTK